MEGHIDQLTPITLVTTVALLCGLTLARFRQPAIVGYILAGVMLGPTGFALISNSEPVQVLAELGVIMLLFLIGMELSLRGFKTVWRVALLTTLLQIVMATGFSWLIGVFMDWPIERVAVFGFALSLSSTAVVIKMLDETGDLRTQVGRITVGILIAQDLAVVPMLLAVSAFGAGAGVDGGTAAHTMGYSVLGKLGFAVGLLAFLVWFLSRRERLRIPFIEMIESRPDITALTALGLCFTLATISGTIGLSTAYGAFIAGLVIGNSNARQPMHAATEPIQSVLLMVFFLSIGLLIDLEYILDNLGLVLVVLGMVTLVKTAINVFILHLLGEPWSRAFHAGVVLGQIGEFSFVLVAAGLAVGVIDAEDYKLIIAVIALSLMISPMWLITTRRLHKIAHKGITSLRGVIGGTLRPSDTINDKPETEHTS